MASALKDLQTLFKKINNETFKTYSSGNQDKQILNKTVASEIVL